MEQVKKGKEIGEEMNLGFENIIKRLEIREQGLKEQVKMLTEKLYAVEN